MCKGGRALKRIFAFILALAMALSFCGCEVMPSVFNKDGETPQGAESEETADAPLAYKLALNESIASLNYYTADSKIVREMMTNCVDSLTEPDAEGHSVAAVADSWYTNDDQSVWTFSIKNGLFWVDYNGTETEYTVTAKDFVDGIRIMADPAKSGSDGEFIRSRIQGLQEYYDALLAADAGTEGAKTRAEVEASFDQMVGVRAIDDYSVEYSLVTSTPYFLTLTQSSTLLLPVEMDFYMEMGEDFGMDNEHMLYCGPYYVSHFERDKRIVLSSNPLYWDRDKVTVPTIEYIKPEDGKSEADLFAEGVLNYADVDVDDYIALQHTDFASRFEPAGNSLSTDCFFLNFNSENPEFKAFVDNENFRLALQHAIDRRSLAYLKDPINPQNAVRNTITPEACITDSLGTDYTDYEKLASIKDIDYYDPELARSYMLKAALSLSGSSGNILNTIKTTVDYLPVVSLDVDGYLPVQMVFACSDSNDDIILAHLIESSIEDAIGRDLIDVCIVCIKDWTKAAVVDGNNFDMILSPLVTEGSSPAVILYELTSGGKYNYGGISLPEYDVQLENAQLSPFFPVRLSALSEAEAMLLNGAYVMPVTSSDNAYCLTTAKPFTMPLTIFGARRYKGLEVNDGPVTDAEYAEMERLNNN